MLTAYRVKLDHGIFTVELIDRIKLDALEIAAVALTEQEAEAMARNLTLAATGQTSFPAGSTGKPGNVLLCDHAARTRGGLVDRRGIRRLTGAAI